MKKQQTVKDRQKLFKKLFISPSYCQPLDPPLLVSPDFINLLLEQSSNASTQYQLQLADDILKVFSQRPTNSLLLCAHDQSKIDGEKCILDTVILRILTLIQTEEQVQLYLERIALMLAYYRITLRNIRKLTQWISKQTYIQKFDSIKLMFIVRLLRLYYCRKLGQSKSPKHYFYIFGSQNTGIQPVQNFANQFCFKNQLTITLSFNSQGQSTKPYNLFLLKTQKKQQFGLSYAQGCLKITALHDGEFLDQFFVMKGLSEQVWYRLIINMSTSETECIVDNQSYKGRSLLRKQKQRKITACIFGRQFFGMIGSILVSNKNWSLDKFDTSQYPYGIDSIDHLISLNKTLLPQNVITSCLPFCTFQVRQLVHCFDIFRRNHSSVADNIVTVDQAISEETVQHLGTCAILLPLFYLARFYNNATYPSILQDLLILLVDIMKNYHIGTLEAQFSQTHFFQVLGQHLADIPHLQTQKSINLIFTIYSLLKRQKSKITFIHDVIWTLNIGIDIPSTSLSQKNKRSQQFFSLNDLKSESQLMSPTKFYKDEVDQLISFYYKKLLQIFRKQTQIAFRSMSLAQVIYWAVQQLQTNQKMVFACCLQHHLNQSILAHQMRAEDLIKLQQSHSQTHYCYLQELLAFYLENSIKKHYENVVQLLKTLLRLFLQKYSACFYLAILRAIKRQIVSSSVSEKQIIKILTDPKLEITSFLVYLSEKTINPDIISEILYICFFIHNHSNSTKKDEVIKFVVNLLRINQQIQIKSLNPVKQLVKKLRKCSQQVVLEKSQNQQQEEETRIEDKQMFEFDCLKKKKFQIDKHRISRIIARSPKPQKLKSYKQIYNIIVNQLSNTLSEKEPTTESNVYTQQPVLVLKEYYKLAQPLFKQSILLFILSSLQKNPELKNLSSLNLFLLESLRQSICYSPQETKSLLTIFTCIFSQIFNSHNSIVEYYCSIKFLKISRSAISLVLPHIISKVIKLADLSQLCQLLMVCLYQMTQSPSQSALQLSRMVLGQVNNKILKKQSRKYSNSQIIQASSQKNHVDKQCELFTKILIQAQQSQLSLQIEDPFSDQNNQQKSKQANEQNESAYELKTIRDNNEEQAKKQQEQKEIELKKILKIRSNQKTKRQPSRKKDCSYQKHVKAIQIYAKLCFKVAQRLICSEQDENHEKTVTKRQSLLKLETQSLVKKSKSAQISYSYQFKSKQVLLEEFMQIMILFFKSIADGSTAHDKNFTKFILSYTLFKLQGLESNANIQLGSSQIFKSIIVNACIPFVIEQVSSIQELCKLISEEDPRISFFQILSKSPFKFQLNDFIAWKKDQSSISATFKDQRYSQFFTSQQKFKKYFAEVEDFHDLVVVGFYQKHMQKHIAQYQSLIASYASQKSFRNVQKLFDTQNAAEQRTRITFLYENQCRFRKYHFQWDQLWGKLRIYHQPYGFWMAQKFKDHVYTYESKQIRNFKFQMSQYSSESGLYPILEAKIIEPWTIVKDNRIKKNKYINSFSQMMKPSHIKVEKSQINDNIFTTMWKGMLGLSKKKSQKKVNQFDVVFISRSTKATGKLFIQNKEDLIFCYEGARQEDSHLSFQRFSLAFNRQTYQKWCLFSIQKIKVHRYLLRYQALQIMLNDGRSIIFEFLNKDKDSFIKEIQKIQKQRLQISNPKLFKINKIAIFDQNFFEYKGLDAKITQSWMKREISNLQYLIKMNRAASRGIYDLSQYMVVPWVVQFKKQKQPRYRDLSKTMGGLGSQQRKKIISQKYHAKDPFNPYPPFYFGTHYSSPGVVFNLLIRLSPFTEYCKHLQGGKFDIPDRLFSSLISAWRSASEEVSDVRQLIPQIYYLPQMLINIDENHFGYTQNHELINHIQIPPWGVNNPYYFTSQLRQIIQSEQISQKINEWIDLIFGYKQKGKEAEASYNVYYYLTYEDYVDAEEDEDDVYKKSKQAQIVHFGQIPPMLFDKPHPKRNNVQGQLLYQLKIVKTINLMNSLKQKPIGLKIANSQLTICKRNQFEVYSIQSDPASLQKKKKFNFQKSMTQTYFLIKKQRSSVYFLEKPYFIIWGYLSNQFRIFSKSTGEIIQSAEASSKVNTLFVNKSQNLILVGTISGILQIFQIQYALNDVIIKKIGTECFPAQIVHISEFDGFYAISFGNYSAIYKITRCLKYLKPSQAKAQVKFFRSFYNPLPIKASFIMTSPLYSIILIDNACMKSYSINGQFIKSISNSAKYFGRFKDGQLQDVFYAIDEDKIVCYSVPDLRSVSILELPDHQEIIQNYIIHKLTIQEIGFSCH